MRLGESGPGTWPAKGGPGGAACAASLVVAGSPIREDAGMIGLVAGVTLIARLLVIAGSPGSCASALALVGFVPYAGSVPDGGRHGYEAAMSVASPHRLAA